MRTLWHLTPEEYQITGADDGSKTSSESYLGGIGFHIEYYWVTHIVDIALDNEEES